MVRQSEYFRTCFGLVIIGLASNSPTKADPVLEFPLKYSLGGLVEVSARENATSTLLMGLWAHLDVATDGSVSGDGIVRYESAAPCEWTPPEPDNGTLPYCRIDELIDGSFTISGKVRDTLHRRNDENPLKAGIFELADSHGNPRLGYAPSRMTLTLTLDRQPREVLSLWGFSTPTIRESVTGAATLGLLSSGAFGQEIEISPISTNHAPADTFLDDVISARQYQFEGTYLGNTPISGKGSLFFVALDPDRLPDATNRSMYLVHDDNSPSPRIFDDSELKAIKAYEADGYQPPSRLDELELQDFLTNTLGGNSDGLSGVALTDDTRQN